MNTEFRYVEHVVLDEVRGGPDEEIAVKETIALFTEVEAGAVLRAEDAQRAAAILDDPDSWHNGPTLMYRASIRKYLVRALLIHACRVDDPVLVGRVRRYEPRDVHDLKWRHPVPAACLHALIAGIAAEETYIRAAAMRGCRNLALFSDLAPVVDEMVGELWALPSGQRNTVQWRDPAGMAGTALLAYALRAGDPDVLVGRIRARAGTQPLPEPAIVAVAALLAVARREADLAALAVNAPARTAMITGLSLAHSALLPVTWQVGIPVGDHEQWAGTVLALAESAARNGKERRTVVKMCQHRDRHAQRAAFRARSRHSP